MATFEHPSVDWWIVGLLTVGPQVGSTVAGKFFNPRAPATAELHGVNFPGAWLR
jgi:hypothetical protein